MKRVHSWFAAGPLFSIAWLVVGTAGALPPPESEPTLPAKDLAPQSIALSGSGYAVDSPTQVKNFLGQFSIRSDWGEIDAAGGVLLARAIGNGSSVGITKTINDTDFARRDTALYTPLCAALGLIGVAGGVRA